MSKSMIKIISLAGGIIAIIAILTVMCIVSINAGVFKTLSIKDISQSKAEISKSNEELELAGTSYEAKKIALVKLKEDYRSEKAKYETISNETIRIIEEATKDEKYFIEYLWVVLGNYAKANSLKLTVVDPGSKVTSDQSSSATPDTAAEETSQLVTTIESSSLATTTTKGGTIKAKDKVITIQVKGNYLDVADFVFEVENDKTLRFKLDNISMRMATGKDIIASFEVKNLVILK